MNCELCGRNARLEKVFIEGSEMDVCSGCSSHGRKVGQRKKFRKEENNDSIIYDFASTIKNARENLGLKQEDLARNIKEKESVVSHVESGRVPNFNLARKLEKFLKIKLINKESVEYKPEKKSSSTMTVGDLIKDKSK